MHRYTSTGVAVARAMPDTVTGGRAMVPIGECCYCAQ